jgi:hypothetical protein
VQPVRLWLFAAPFSVPSRGRFLRDLAALAKAVIAQRAGRINREELFGRLGQTEAVVLAGLGALSARGMLRVRCVEQRVLLEEGSGQGEQDLGGDSLSALLEDVAAYRRYMQSAPVGELLGVDPH